jgi:hypothetical protein
MGSKKRRHSMRASAQVTAPGAITSRIAAVSTRPNRQNRSTCSRMSVPLVQKQKLGVVPRLSTSLPDFYRGDSGETCELLHP